MAMMRNAEIIIGEGITEKYYFTSLRDVLVVKPAVKPLKPYNMDELAKAIDKYAKEGYTKIYCLIDMDNKVATPAMMKKYQQLKQRYNNKRVGRTECEVCFYESYPSVELFFYYYFESSTAEKTNDGLKSWLKHRCGYDTSERYLATHSLHGTLVRNGGCLEDAISHAKDSVRLRDGESYSCSYTEIGNLIESLGIKIEK